MAYAVIAANGAGKSLAAVCGTCHSTYNFHGINPFHTAEDHRGCSHRLFDNGIEGLVGKVSVMSAAYLRIESGHLHCDKLESPSFEAAQNLPYQSSLYGAGLDNNKSPFH